MGIECEANTYAGYMQQVVRLAGLGYYNYKVTEYPLKKRTLWPTIDQKIIAKYPLLGLSKFQRARRKAAGLLNAQFVRFDNCATLVISDGRDDCGIRAEESPQDIRKTPLRFSPTKNLTFQIHQPEGKFTVSLERGCYRDITAYYREAALKSALDAVALEFNGLDRACPSWRGLYAQKVQLRHSILVAARQAGRKWDAKAFRVSKLKKSVRVFAPAKNHPPM